MGKNQKYSSVAVIIHKDDKGNTRYSEPSGGKEVRGEVVNVLRNTGLKAQQLEHVGQYTDVLMGADSILPITIEDEIRGVPDKIPGTGIVKEAYDPAKHDRANPVTGGMPGMIPIDAREYLPEDKRMSPEMLDKVRRVEKKLGKKLAGWGTKEEVHALTEEVKEIVAKGGME